MPEDVKKSLAAKDDLVFFVTLDPCPTAFVRRRSLRFPEDLRYSANITDKASKIDWKSSVIMNIVMHTEFELLVIRGDVTDLGTCLAAYMNRQGPYTQSRQVNDGNTRIAVHDVQYCKVHPNLPQPSSSCDDGYHHVYFELEGTCNPIQVAPDQNEQESCFGIALLADVYSSWSRGVYRSQSSCTGESVPSWRGLVTQSSMPRHKHDSVKGHYRMPDSKPKILVFSGYVTYKELVSALSKASEKQGVFSFLPSLGSSSKGSVPDVCLMNLRDPSKHGKAQLTVSHHQSRDEGTSSINCTLTSLYMDVDALAVMISKDV